MRCDYAKSLYQEIQDSLIRAVEGDTRENEFNSEGFFYGKEPLAIFPK